MKNQPLVIDYVKLIHRTNACINSLLRDDALSINDETYVDIRRGLKHCNRFSLLGELKLINKTSREIVDLEETSLLLTVHYRWLIKFVRKLYRLLNTNSANVSKGTIEATNDFFVTIDDINRSLSSINEDRSFRKLTKLLKKRLSLPLPHNSERSTNAHVKLRKATKSFSPWPIISNSSNSNPKVFIVDHKSIRKELKIMSVQTNDSRTMRRRLVSLWNQIYFDRTSCDLDSTFDGISEIEEYCDNNRLDLLTQTDLSMVLERIKSIDLKELIDMSAGVRSWPIYEYLFLLLVHKSYRHICADNKNAIEDEDDLKSLKNLLENFVDLPGVPANLIALLSTMFSNEIDSNRRSLLIHEFCVLLFDFTRNNYAVKDSKMLLHWNGINEYADNDDVETFVTNTCDVPKVKYIIIFKYITILIYSIL